MLKDRFLDRLKTCHCLDKKVLVAVSGGLDSAVLLQLMCQSQNGVTVVHANFQLRGSESDGDQLFVEQLAHDYRISCIAKRFETNYYAKERGISIQMAARELRYEWFSSLVRTEGFDFVVTAHHLNDQLETTLHNFTRGTGLQGLLGMRELSGYILRPLLTFTRLELEAYAHQENIAWRDDQSNSSDDYQRNFIRHHVVPLLKQMNPSLEETYARNEQRLNAAAELMLLGMDSLRQKFVSSSSHQTKIRKSLLSTLKFPHAIVYEFVKEFGFNLEQCDEMTKALDGQSGKHVLSDTHLMVIDRDELIIAVREGKIEDVIIDANTEAAKRGPARMNITNGLALDPPSDPGQVALDKSKVTFPLTWRNWKAGDSFYPLGMKHRKKVSDFLIDNKVSLADKQQVTVITSGEDIAWVVGYRMDDRFKLTQETREAIVLTLSS